MAVTVDAVGPNSSGFGTTTVTSPATWTHPGGGSCNAVVVAFALDAITTTATATATYGGTSMTLLAGPLQCAGLNAGALWVFGLLNPLTGSQTVSVSFSSFSSSDAMEGGSVSFNGATAFGTAVTSTGTSATESVTVSPTASSSQIFAATAVGNTIPSPSPGTSQFINNIKGAAGSDDGNIAGATLAGGGTGTITWSSGSSGDTWAIAGIEVQGAATAAPPAAAQQYAPGWHPGRGLPGMPGGTPFAVVPQDGGSGNPALSVNAGLATGTGAALSAIAAIGANAALATGTGTAQPPVAATGANAGLATGTGAAQSPLIAEGANAGLATGAGTAQQPVAAIGVNAGLASATGTAQPPVTAIGAASTVATGTGTAQSPTPAIGVIAQLATGTGAALNPTVSTSSAVNAPAGLATAAGTALNATVLVAGTFTIGSLKDTTAATSAQSARTSANALTAATAASAAITASTARSGGPS